MAAGNGGPMNQISANDEARHFRKFRHADSQLVALTLFACAAIALVGHATPASAGDVAGATTRPAAVPEYDKQAANVEFAGRGFADVIDSLRDTRHVNIYVDWKRID